MRKHLTNRFYSRGVRLGSRGHAKKEGRLDGLAGIPAANWNERRMPSERGLDALGELAQAQLGADFYARTDRLLVEWQVAHRDLLLARRLESKAVIRADEAQDALDSLRRRLEGEAQ